MSNWANTQHALSELWHSRQPRERGLILLASAVLLLGAVYGLVLEPAITHTQRLSKALPLQQQTLAQVQQLAAQLQASGGAKGEATTRSQAHLQASLVASNIVGTVSTAAPWKITISSANGDSLWAWLNVHPAISSTMKRNAKGQWAGDVVLE